MANRSQLVWRCRRGTLELDLCLARFLERGYGVLAQTDKEIFARMVERSNDDLTAWLINGVEPADEGFARLAQAIRAFASGKEGS